MKLIDDIDLSMNELFEEAGEFKKVLDTISVKIHAAEKNMPRFSFSFLVESEKVIARPSKEHFNFRSQIEDIEIIHNWYFVWEKNKEVKSKDWRIQLICHTFEYVNYFSSGELISEPFKDQYTYSKNLSESSWQIRTRFIAKFPIFLKAYKEHITFIMNEQKKGIGLE